MAPHTVGRQHSHRGAHWVRQDTHWLSGCNRFPVSSVRQTPMQSVGVGVQVVYVSPLKALAVDIHQNLERPLAEIEAVAAELGLDVPKLSVAVRTGDTPQAARTAMTKVPPDILVTTPESLYLLVTAERSRAVLRSVGTVIVDEIHALARTSGEATWRSPSNASMRFRPGRYPNEWDSPPPNGP